MLHVIYHICIRQYRTHTSRNFTEDEKFEMELDRWKEVAMADDREGSSRGGNSVARGMGWAA